MNKKRLDIIREYLNTSNFAIRTLLREIEANSTSLKLACGISLEIGKDATLRKNLIKALETQGFDYDLMVAIIDAGENASASEIAQTLMSNYCENHFKCKKQVDCDDYAKEFGSLDCSNCGCHRTCEECLHFEKCPCIYDYDKKQYAMRLEQEKAKEHCKKRCITGYGDKGLEMSCRECVASCKQYKYNGIFVYKDNALVYLLHSRLEECRVKLLKMYDSDEDFCQGPLDMEIF